MNAYQETAIAHDSKAMTLADAKILAELTDNESLSNQELVAVQNALRLFASKSNQALHITDGGAIYITDNHDFREATEVTRLA